MLTGCPNSPVQIRWEYAIISMIDRENPGCIMNDPSRLTALEIQEDHRWMIRRSGLSRKKPQ